MVAVVAVWLASGTGARDEVGVHEAALQGPPLFGNELGSVAAPLERQQPDAAPWVPPEPEANTGVELDLELTAGDEGEPVLRDMLVLPETLDGRAEGFGDFEEAEGFLDGAEWDSPDAPRQGSYTADAGAFDPEQPGAREGEEEIVEPEPYVDDSDPDAGSSSAATAPEPLAAGEPCGMGECPEGLVCCNESCGTCVAPGQTCSQLSCSMPAYPASAFCGRNTCSVGEVCCNISCGICAAPGESCSERICS